MGLIVRGSPLQARRRVWRPALGNGEPLKALGRDLYGGFFVTSKDVSGVCLENKEVVGEVQCRED